MRGRRALAKRHRERCRRKLSSNSDNAVDVALWLRGNLAIDQFYAFGLEASLFLVEPVIASQHNLFGREARIFDE